METSTLWAIFDEIIVDFGIHTIVEYEAPSPDATVVLEKLSIPGGVFKFKSGTLLVNTLSLESNIEISGEDAEIIVQVRSDCSVMCDLRVCWGSRSLGKAARIQSRRIAYLCFPLFF